MTEIDDIFDFLIIKYNKFHNIKKTFFEEVLMFTKKQIIRIINGSSIILHGIRKLRFVSFIYLYIHLVISSKKY